MQKKILITNFEMKNFMGSEINAATIAKRFKDVGYKVYMLAMYFGDPLYSQVKDNFDEIIDIKKDDFDFSNIEFDIVWVHHSFLLDWLIFKNEIKAKKIVVSALSGMVPFETVPEYANDLSLILANSEETKESLINEGNNKVYVFENYSFIKYYEQENEVKELKNIAIVSNHIPKEVMQAKKLLEDSKYNVDIYGVEGKKELINDEILKKYDVIISIGKTVQYAMSLKIPIYVYDIHGGDGYLTLENLEKNRNKNFSGRGFNKKNSEQIYDEIVNNFKEAVKITEKLREYAYDNFCFERNIQKIIKLLEDTKDVNVEYIRQKYKFRKRKFLITKQLSDYLIGKYEDALRTEKNELFTEIKRLRGIEEELRNTIIEKDMLIQKHEEIIKQKGEQIKQQTEIIEIQKGQLDIFNKSRFWRVIKRLKKLKL